jgi:hypothetical protein
MVCPSGLYGATGVGKAVDESNWYVEPNYFFKTT